MIVNTNVTRNRKNERAASNAPNIPKAANPIPKKKIIERTTPRYD
jgi:hypothetical protein